VNPSAAQLMNQSREALNGKIIWEVFPEAVDSPFYEQYKMVLSDRVAADIETYYPPRNRWFKAHAYPFQEGMAVLFEDVTRQHKKEVTIVSDMLRALNAHLDVAHAFPELARGLRELTGCDRSSLSVFDERHERATIVALDSPRADVHVGRRLRMSDIPGAASVLAGRPHVVPNFAAELASPLVRTIYAEGLRSAVSVPLRATARVAGMLTLTWRKLSGCSVTQLPLLGQVAEAIALAVEKSRLFEEVRAGHERLQALSHRLLEVQEDERQHLARELHDEIGQALTAIRLGLDSVTRLPPAAAEARITEMQEQIYDLVTRVRNLSLDLRPAMLDDLGLLPALLWLFERCTAQTDLQVNFEHQGLERRFAAGIETAAYRLVQEALTNVARHGGVTHATVRAWADAETLGLQIVDQGMGFDATRALASGRTSGVAGMRERVRLLGGKFAIESTRGHGTRVGAELPLGRPVHGGAYAHHDRAGG